MVWLEWAIRWEAVEVDRYRKVPEKRDLDALHIDQRHRPFAARNRNEVESRGFSTETGYNLSNYRICPSSYLQHSMRLRMTACA